MNRLIMGMAACGMLATGCDGGPSSQPPPEIAEACMPTMMGIYQLPAAEWVKPLTDPGRGRWESSPEHGVIFRGERRNPLNQTTSVISVLLVPQPAPPVGKAYCKGYYSVSRVDVDGMQQPLLPFLSELFAAHWAVLATYPPERFSETEPLTLDWGQ